MHLTPRDMAIVVIGESAQRSHTDLHNAILDLRRNPTRGDESLLYRLLDHEDAMVVSATLFALCEVYGQREQLKNVICQLAAGDERDSFEMPIQTTAISQLATLARKDQQALQQLVAIAENPKVSETPRKRAWHYLAELHGIPWTREDGDEMLISPESIASETIRNRIRTGIACGQK